MVITETKLYTAELLDIYTTRYLKWVDEMWRHGNNVADEADQHDDDGDDVVTSWIQ